LAVFLAFLTVPFMNIDLTPRSGGVDHLAEALGVSIDLPGSTPTPPRSPQPVPGSLGTSGFAMRSLVSGIVFLITWWLIGRISPRRDVADD
jgi:hypothetical protein